MSYQTKRTTLALAIIITLIGLYFIGQKANTAWPNPTPDKIWTVEELKAGAQASKTYVLDSYVIGKYDCLACTTTDSCLCEKGVSAIIIDSAGPAAPEEPLLSSQMIAYSDAGKYLHLGQHYRLKLAIDSNPSIATSSIWRARIVGYELIGQ